jgi:hypothetical protein
MNQLLAIFLSLITSAAYAVPVGSIAAKHPSPLIPKGGVLLVQLLSETLGNDWPATLNVTLENGQVIEGHIGWVEHNKNSTHWAKNNFLIRPIAPTDDTSTIHPKDTITGPVLLAELPPNVQGLIHFGGDAVDPTWIELAKELPVLNITPPNLMQTQQVLESAALPEWNSLEYWRWTLVASRKGIAPPEPPNQNEVARLASLQAAQLWRVGFDRLARSSRGVAAECRDLLTNTANDDNQSFACWITRSDQINALLSIILDPTTSSRQLAARALRWTEEQQPFVQWLESVYGKMVSIATANPTLESQMLALRWHVEDEIPLVVEIPAKETARVNMERLLVVDTSLFGPATIESQIEWLDLQIGKQTSSLPIVPQKVVARPPQVALQTLHPLWNLQQLQVQVPNKVDNGQSTAVQLRKLLGGWELFVECYGRGEGTSLMDGIIDLQKLKGAEAITILHEPSDGVIAIPPEGTPVQNNITEEVKIHRSAYENKWAVRIELPDAWVSDDSVSFSIIRSHGDSDHIETGPLPCVPWNINPKPIVIDLTQWDEVQQFPTHPPK